MWVDERLLLGILVAAAVVGFMGVGSVTRQYDSSRQINLNDVVT